MRGYSQSDLTRQTKVSQPEDFRGPFGRDKDRVLYSSAFRRLAGKTQVVAASELGDFHNRMTHSLKVAQLGHRLAQQLQLKDRSFKKRRHQAHFPPDPELVEAACLAHDLGHPPFGHIGEEALKVAADEIVVARIRSELGSNISDREVELKKIEFGGFEGNAQTLRILTRLSSRHPRGTKGLNLTRVVLDATIKYPWERQMTGKGSTKWNIYHDDLECARWIRSDHEIGPNAPTSFEAQLMDWCDDVTYACHDVQDFYRAGLIPLDRLFAFPPARQGASAEESGEPIEAREFFNYVDAKWSARLKPFDRERAMHEWRSLYRLMPVSGPYDGGRTIKSEIHRLNSRLITHFMNAVKCKDGKPYRYDGHVEISDSARYQCELLKELNWFYVIERPALASQQHGQRQIVMELLKIFYASEGDRVSLLPKDRQEDVDDGVDYLRACIDHVASMREAEAVAMHQRLTGTHVGLHSDGVWRI